MSFIGKGIVICLLILAISAVSAWMTESLKLPMLEVGEIWVSSVQKVQLKIFNFMSTFVDIYSYTFYIFFILGFVIGYYLYNLLFTPLNRVRILGDIGYLPDGKFTLKEISNSVKKRRVIGEVPPVYPNGWFGLMEGFKLKRGESTSISVLGKFHVTNTQNKTEQKYMKDHLPAFIYRKPFCIYATTVFYQVPNRVYVRVCCDLYECL